MKASLQTATKQRRKRGITLSDRQREVLEAHAFQAGQSGNISGRPKSLMAAAYRRALERKIVNDPQGRTYADALAEKMVALGLKGDVKALAEVTDRVDGRPQQAITMDGDGSGLSIEIATMTPEQKRERVAQLLAKARGE